MGLINKEYERLNILESDWDAFMNALPYYIYPILAVLIVPVMLLTKSEFGPMRAADRRVEETGEIYWPHSKPIRKTEKMNEYAENKSKASLILVPITILLVTLFGLLIPLGFPFKKIDGSAFRVALSTAYLFAAISLILLMVIYKVKKFGEAFDIYVSGMQKMMTVVIILVLAWSLGGVLDKMGTANYLVSIMDGNVPVFLIPAILFAIGAVMSFANGTSWGTFAIMMPLAIPLAYHLDASIYIAIGAVISGGIFGDHCSPISDSTILSSTGAGCDHVDHNKTQIPIALFNACITLIAFLLAGLYGSIYTAVIAINLMIIGTIILGKISKRKDFEPMDKML
ncbi:MAG: Na+/H+ antiporter NhaC family protein [Solibacillus sp.]